ncbi:MAG: GDSL-type esterase/lipase family protein [Erysipelotrichales bacterium]|nr:GDSL-type esterase/lipase family protein [Erysipelotrichales bacterium]
MVEKLDKFMDSETEVPSNVEYFNPLQNSNVKFLGLPFVKENQNYQRISNSFIEKFQVVNPKLIELGAHTAGVSIVFKTDTPILVLRSKLNKGAVLWNMSPILEIGFDLYLKINNKWEFYQTSKHKHLDKSHEAIMFEKLDRSEKEVLINFPCYSAVLELEIGLEEKSFIKTSASFSDAKRWLFYGTSITQGACASRPGMSYVNILSRYFNKEIVNLGFSGNALAESVMAEMILEVSGLDIVFIDIDANAVEFNTLKPNLELFLKTIRKYSKDLKIILISRVLDVYQKTNKKTNAIYLDTLYFQREIVKKLNDQSLFFINGYDIFPLKEYSDYTVDGIHFSDLGYYKFADYLKTFLTNNNLVKSETVYELFIPEISGGIGPKYLRVCPKCQTKNNIDLKYCQKCGIRILELICPICQSHNKASSNACAECGQKFLIKRK